MIREVTGILVRINCKNAEKFKSDELVVSYDDLQSAIDEIEMIEPEDDGFEDIETEIIAQELCDRYKMNYEDLIIPENFDELIKLQHIAKVFDIYTTEEIERLLPIK